MICSRCGTDNLASAKFCSECGAPLPVYADANGTGYAGNASDAGYANGANGTSSPAQAESGFGLSLAGLITGLVGMHIVGLVLSIIGFNKASKLKKSGDPSDNVRSSWVMGLVGLIVSAVGLFIVIVFTLVLGVGIYAAAVNGTLEQYMDEFGVTSTQSISTTVPNNGGSKNDTTADNGTSGFQITVADTQTDAQTPWGTSPIDVTCFTVSAA